MFIGFLITYFLLQIPIEIAYNSSIIIFFISIAIPLILGIIRIFKKEYLNGTLQTLSSLIFGGAGFMFLSFILMFYPYDFFADNLKIPENIKFEKPITLNQNSKYQNIKSSKTDLILLDGLQGGIYKFKIFLPKIEKGKVYLKIYEITKNEILSEDDIKRRSEIEVYNPTNEIKEFEPKDDFFVYEGDWDQFYGSRIEVWFRPEDNPKKERKLFSKNYIIQGWQR